MTPTAALLIGTLTALIPLTSSAMLIVARQVDRATELARLALVIALSVLFLLTGPWAWLTYWMRPAAALALTAAVIRSARRMIRGGPTTRTVHWDTCLMAVAAFGLVALDYSAISSAFPTKDNISVEFPLHGRMFVVLQGGRSPLTNPFHYGSPAGRLSLDVTALGSLGNRARRLLSQDLSDYFVFGVPVKSPCAGKVVAAGDGLADNPPGRPDLEHPPGNHLLVRCDHDQEVVVLLAHLQMDSVRKRSGERVQTGEVVGAVGNSGNTSEPHLHIQATRGDLTKGSAVSMLVDGRFLTANSLVFNP